MGKFDSHQFKRLKKKWYDKLKAQGFRDIENDREQFIDHRDIFDFSQLIGFRVGLMEEIRDYYTWATHCVTLGKFKSLRDKKIWGYHAQGVSAPKIAKLVSLHRAYVSVRIRKIREYLRQQKPKD